MQILREETVEKYGYDPEDLPKTSLKPVLAECKSCGQIRVTPKVYGERKCRKCSSKGIVRKLNKARENNPKFLETEIMKRSCTTNSGLICEFPQCTDSALFAEKYCDRHLKMILEKRKARNW